MKNKNQKIKKKLEKKSKKIKRNFKNKNLSRKI